MANADGEKSTRAQAHWWWILVSSDFVWQLLELYGPSMDCQGSVSTWAQSAGSSLARFAARGRGMLPIMTLNFSIALNGFILLLLPNAPTAPRPQPSTFMQLFHDKRGKKREENCEICAAVIIKRLLTAKFNISCIHHYDNMQLHKHSYIYASMHVCVPGVSLWRGWNSLILYQRERSYGTLGLKDKLSYHLVYRCYLTPRF